jgi:hypothetical protein
MSCPQLETMRLKELVNHNALVPYRGRTILSRRSMTLDNYPVSYDKQPAFTFRPPRELAVATLKIRQQKERRIFVMPG